MALTTEKLERMCGIDTLPALKRKPPVWIKGRMEFLGAERYVLGYKDIELSLTGQQSGFSLTFRSPVVFQADQLLGPKVRAGMLVDVVIKPELDAVPELSLAAMTDGLYPRVLRSGEIVEI